MKLALRKKRGTVIRRIYELFEPKAGGRKKQLFGKKRVLSKDALAVVPGSRMTITKAKAYLGVKSTYIAGRHVWLPPTRTLQEALEKARGRSRSTLYKTAMSQEERSALRGETLVGTMRQVMLLNKCDIDPRDLKEQVRGAGGLLGNTGARAFAKRKLGLVMLRLDRKWHWLYPAPELDNWLRNYLGEGVKEQDELYAAAEAAGYSHWAVNLFRAGRGYVTRRNQSGNWYWWDGSVGGKGWNDVKNL